MPQITNQQGVVSEKPALSLVNDELQTETNALLQSINEIETKVNTIYSMNLSKSDGSPKEEGQFVDTLQRTFTLTNRFKQLNERLHLISVHLDKIV